uniref:Uncharacterized protein n=1 Tax=Cacopsylla melanoneura TaxID=428564 RepID=A0A8D8WY60_9HEMI
MQSLGTTILNICDAYFKKNINVTTAGVITRIMDYVDWIPLIECDMSDQCSDMGPLKKMDIVNGLDISFRPCSIQSKYTIASGDDGFNFKYAKTNKIFQCPQFNLYVLPPMDLSSFDYGDSFSQLTMDKYKQKIISACTGLVMKGDVERNNHVGSCSLVRDGKRFYVKTNSHVINGSGQTKDISGKLTKYQSELKAVFACSGKTLVVSLDKLMLRGNDYAVFSVETAEARGFLASLEIDAPMMSNLETSANGSCYISACRQTDDVFSKNKNRVMLRTLLITNDNRVIGYSTPRRA